MGLISKFWFAVVFLVLSTGVSLRAELRYGTVSLRSLASDTVTVDVLPEETGKKRVAVIRTAKRVIYFREDDAFFYANGVKVDLPARMAWYERYGGLLLSPGWNELYLQPLLNPSPVSRPEDRAPILFLDPGHGGSQLGGRGLDIGLVEKERVLQVSLLLKELMEKEGWQVVLSRSEDQPLGLQERTRMANQAQADLFLSIHFNAAENRQARGVEMFVLRPFDGPWRRGDDGVAAMPGNQFDAENLVLAWYLQKGVLGAVEWTDRGVRRGNFVVLKELAMPGVLAELGFLTNTEEEALIARPETLQKLAEGLRDGLLAWWKR